MIASTTLGALAGAVFGISLLGVFLAVVPPRPNLASQVRRWDDQRRRRGLSTATRASTMQAAAGDRLVRFVEARGLRFTQTRLDLELLERPLGQHLLTKAGMGLLGLLLPSLTSALLWVAGISVGVTFPLAFGVLLAVVFFLLPDLGVRREAKQRRDDFRQTLAVFLDLVVMSLAGGRGITEALPSAARLGRGWGFDLITSTLSRARYAGSTPWVALRELGERTGIRELSDLGSSLQMVADDGAKVRTTLAARATTQRRRALAQAEGDAKEGDQSITMAQILLGAGFLIFLMFAATMNVLSSF